MNPPSSRQAVVALFTLGLLAGCGGSSGGGGGPVVTAPDAPSLALAPQSIKTFAFSWAEVSGQTEYRLLENADGSSGYSEVAIIAADATSHELEVFLPGRINASYILAACNSAGCTDSAPVFVSGTLAEAIGYFKASNKNVQLGGGIQFGISVALSADGTTLAVGGSNEGSTATGINGDQAADAAAGIGAVYVFSQSDGVWSQQAYVKASNAINRGSGFNARFGFSVALSADGNTLAVGAPNEASNATGIDGDQTDTSASGSGAVYVFTRSGSDWSQQAYVKASNTGDGDQFGFSVALAGDGNTLAVGAPFERSSATGIDGDQANIDAPLSGAVYVFSQNGGDWSQQAYVKASNTRADARFGESVALAADGNTLAVGSPRETSNATGIDGNQADDSVNQAGAVYVFSRSESDWSQQAYVKASNTGAGDFAFFGGTVALAADGNTLAVGAPFEGSSATGIDGEQNNDDAPFSGAVYVFERSGEVWAQQVYLKASNAAVNAEFGWSVALAADGNTLAVGSPYEASNATGINGNETDSSEPFTGAAYVFRRDGGVWSQQAYVKASNTDVQNIELYGWSVALAADANTLAVGARFENGGATGIGGDQTDTSGTSSGAVYLY
ncbi:MAG: hypothetical protein JJT85_10565 [Chromatiales bacterium]|nr:hypothetical protein [Chromatiales bacterium]